MRLEEKSRGRFQNIDVDENRVAYTFVSPPKLARRCELRIDAHLSPEALIERLSFVHGLDGAADDGAPPPRPPGGDGAAGPSAPPPPPRAVVDDDEARVERFDEAPTADARGPPRRGAEAEGDARAGVARCQAAWRGFVARSRRRRRAVRRLVFDGLFRRPLRPADGPAPGFLLCRLARVRAAAATRFELRLEGAARPVLVARRGAGSGAFAIFDAGGGLAATVDGLPWPGAGRAAALRDASDALLATLGRPRRAAPGWRRRPRELVGVAARVDGARAARLEQRRPEAGGDGSFSLAFYGGRCGLASSKNFVLESRGRPALQLGKVGRDAFVLDFDLPPVVALGLALAHAFV